MGFTSAGNVAVLLADGYLYWRCLVWRCRAYVCLTGNLHIFGLLCYLSFMLIVWFVVYVVGVVWFVLVYCVAVDFRFTVGLWCRFACLWCFCFVCLFRLCAFLVGDLVDVFVVL